MRGSVRGSVVRAETEDPVPGVLVSGSRKSRYPRRAPPLASLSALADAAGAFKFDDLVQGEWVFTTQSPGGEILGRAIVRVFDNAFSDVTIAVPRASRDLPGGGDDDRDAVRDVQPTAPSPVPEPVRGGVLGHVVREANGQPLSGATISVVSGDGLEPDVRPVTDADGCFILDGLQEGEWLLRAVGRHGETGTATVHVFNSAQSDVTIEVGDGPRGSRRVGGNRTSNRSDKAERAMRGNLQGRVIQMDSRRPVPDASIIVVTGPGAAPDMAPVTNDSGTFALDGLPAGEWILRALTTDGRSGEAAVRISAGTTANVTIQVGGGPDISAE